MIVGITKLILMSLIVIVLVRATITGFEQIDIKSFTFAQRLKRSFISGCMASIFVLSFPAFLFVSNLDNPLAQTDFSTMLFTTIICVIPVQILVTLGIFGRLTYINFFLNSGAKK